MTLATTLTQSEYPDLLEDLLESDVAYFRAAAACEDVLGLRISYMPGLESLAAACVVHQISAPPGDKLPQWLQVLEHRISILGFGHARFYQQRPDAQLEKQFRKNGYRPAQEIALLNTFEDKSLTGDGDTKVRLQPVLTEGDWSLKLKLHQAISHDPDGHVSLAETWLQMEQQKCDAGYMEPYLIFREEVVCGAVNYAPGGRIGRLKNIVVHPRWRHKGIAVQAARIIAHMAKERDMVAAGCFAMEDGPAINMYRNAGYFPVTCQTEWYKCLK